jgi:hypothetical protein
MNQFILILITATIAGLGKCCSSDSDCPVDATCTGDQCVCSKGYLLSEDSSICLPYVTEYNGECTESTQCEWLGPNSECKYVCRCQTGYRWFGGNCIKYAGGLGQECSEDLDCFDGYSLQSLSCTDKKCVCAEGYYSRGETDCRKIALNVNDTCALDIDCQATNTVCHLGKCQEPSDKLWTERKEEDEEQETVFLSYSTSQNSCTKAEDCADVANSECYENTGTCICTRGYFFNEEGTECVPEVGVNANCQKDEDCLLKPGKCDTTTGVCYCRDYYFVEDGNRNCVKTMSQNNWNCLSKEWCYALGTYAFCSSNETCECSKVADLDEKNLLCVSTRKPDDDMCFTDTDCKYIKRGYCIDEKCTCKENYLLVKDQCLPVLGAPCDEEVTCGVEDSECRSNVCTCAENYIAQGNDKCYSLKDHLGDSCEIDIQCSEKINYAKCREGICDCDDEHVAHDICYEKKEFGAYCDNSVQCTVSLGENVVCRSRKCQCPTGETMKEGECSSGITIAGNIVVIVCMLVFKGVVSKFS